MIISINTQFIARHMILEGNTHHISSKETVSSKNRTVLYYRTSIIEHESVLSPSCVIECLTLLERILVRLRNYEIEALVVSRCDKLSDFLELG